MLTNPIQIKLSLLIKLYLILTIKPSWSRAPKPECQRGRNKAKRVLKLPKLPPCLINIGCLAWLMIKISAFLFRRSDQDPIKLENVLKKMFQFSLTDDRSMPKSRLTFKLNERKARVGMWINQVHFLNYCLVMQNKEIWITWGNLVNPHNATFQLLTENRHIVLNRESLDM